MNWPGHTHNMRKTSKETISVIQDEQEEGVKSFFDIVKEGQGNNEAEYQFDSGRYRGQKIKVSKVSLAQLQRYQDMARTPKARAQGSSVDEAKVTMLVVKNHLIEPNLAENRYLDLHQVKTLEESIMKTFDPGEFGAVAECILTHSGIGVSCSKVVADTIEDIKKS